MGGLWPGPGLISEGKPLIHKITRRRPWAAAALLSSTVLVAAATVPLTASASAEGDAASSPRAKQGTVDGVMQHLINLEEIGDDHGSRASGTPGYAASKDYVVKKLRKSGYDPTVQEFDFPFFEQLAPSTFEQTAPTPTTYVEDTDFALMTYSGSGDVTAAVEAVDLNLADLATAPPAAARPLTSRPSPRATSRWSAGAPAPLPTRSSTRRTPARPGSS